jgi:hypothetical protein
MYAAFGPLVIRAFVDAIRASAFPRLSFFRFDPDEEGFVFGFDGGFVFMMTPTSLSSCLLVAASLQPSSA